MDFPFFIAFLALTTVFTAYTVEAAPKQNDNDVDAGDLRKDIPDINLASKRHLFEGDIALPSGRNGLRNDTTRWKFPIPYILSDTLDLNAKGVIHQAFEMYRLKSCVDFKPYEGESTYLHIQKLDGCWSYVGDFHEGQNVSIGAGCDTKAVVEHELLHALGFYHEQSRTDRDDYVKIWWDEILPGKEHNFNKYDDNFITDLNTPYDYESIMHYRPLSFNKNESVPTITTAIPAFNEIIGQRLDFSAIDLLRLNRMYNCTSTHTLLDQCSFELINICGMVQNMNDDADWVQKQSTPGMEDHTLIGKCRDAGYFMHFDTSSGQKDKTALLESRILYPKSNQQCLQFFYKMTGGSDNLLVIWLRLDDGTGNVRKVMKVQTIKADGDDSWKIAHVTLHAKGKFRYLFQGIKGSQNTGGIFIDDISLTETRCPNGVWQIKNFTGLLNTTNKGDKLESPRFYSPEGYGFGATIYPHGRLDSTNEGYTSLYFHLCSGENDVVMEWPAANRQATITAMDQDPDIKSRMSSSRSFTTDKDPKWDKPVSGTLDPSCNCYRGPSWGWSTFISHKQLHRRSFLKNDDLIIFIDFEDLTSLVKTEVPINILKPSNILYTHERPRRAAEPAGNWEKHQPQSAAQDPCDPNPCLNEGACVNRNGEASCRCVQRQMFLYAGERCESSQIHGDILGMLIGGAAGTLTLTIAVIAILTRRHR
ncbi:meprin A subunit alpha [Acipenser ruthenus]|uniref:meprin A subunit alpha n=1 Tax=Acipenser ruthenus TaxID=7906 RepID=UPI002740C3F9|nr:meprin A subunit alpha [Acipenser ruthenus]